MGIRDFFRRKSDGGNIVTSEQLAASLASGYMSDAGAAITPVTAMQIATVFACVRVLAESVGMLPLSIKRKIDRRTETITETPLARVWKEGPNSYMTAQEYKELITTHLALRGNHYAFISETKGRTFSALELLPLDPGQVKPEISPNYEVIYKVKMADGRTESVPANKIFHVRLFTMDGLNGLSPITQARNAIGLAKVTEQHGSRLFKNAAKPSGGFKTEKPLKKEQVDELKKQLADYSGDDAFKSMILHSGFDWFQTTMSSDDAQFLETRKFQRSEICGIFRVPPHMIGDLERATFSNIEHQGLDFVRSSLMPYLTRIEHRIDKSLITEPGEYAKFNANALMRGDMKARAEFYTKQLQNGALSPNEIRDFEDMDPRENGDIYLTPMNMTVSGGTAPTNEEQNNDPQDA